MNREQEIVPARRWKNGRLTTEKEIPLKLFTARPRDLPLIRG